MGVGVYSSQNVRGWVLNVKGGKVNSMSNSKILVILEWCGGGGGGVGWVCVGGGGGVWVWVCILAKMCVVGF